MKKSTKNWHTKKSLAKWFKSLTPEKRLEIAMQIERLRREAKLVGNREDM